MNELGMTENEAHIFTSVNTPGVKINITYPSSWEKIFLLQVRKKHLQALVKLLDEAYYRTKLLYEMLK